jgi:hypothetical protein
MIIIICTLHQQIHIESSSKKALMTSGLRWSFYISIFMPLTEDHHDFIFTFGRKPISGPGGVKGALKSVCKNAGVPYGRKTPNGIIMHDFRRTVKTNMPAAGVSKVCRDLILGHCMQGMDTHYIVPSEEVLMQAMDKYTRWLDDQSAKSVASVDQNVDQRAY